MPWFRLDDSFHSHPKVIAAGNEAVGLYVRCGTYAAEHLTDGFIAEHVALLYGSPALADALVRTKLWRRVRGGWRMPDYLDYNPSREAVENERQKAAERQRRHRSVTVPGHSRDTKNSQSVFQTDPVDNSRDTAEVGKDPTSQDVPSRRDNGVTNGVSHTTPTRPDPSIGVTAVTDPARGRHSRAPNDHLNGTSTPAARHPSARSVQQAIADATPREP